MTKGQIIVILILLFLILNLIYIKIKFLYYRDKLQNYDNNSILFIDYINYLHIVVCKNDTNQSKINILHEIEKINNVNFTSKIICKKYCCETNITIKELILPNYSLNIFYVHYEPFGFPPIFIPINSKLVYFNGHIYQWKINKELKFKFSLINLIYIILLFLILCISTLYTYYCLIRLKCLYLLKNKKIDFTEARSKTSLFRYIVLPIIIICFVYIEFLLYLFFIELRILYKLNSLLFSFIYMFILLFYIIVYSSLMRYIFYKAPRELFPEVENIVSLNKLLKEGVFYTLFLFVIFLFLLYLNSFLLNILNLKEKSISIFSSIFIDIIVITIGISFIFITSIVAINHITYQAPEEIFKIVDELARKLNIKISPNNVRILKNSEETINAGMFSLPKLFKYLIISEGCFKKLDKDEIKAVIAHELGHYYKKHSLKRILIYITIFLPLLKILQFLVNMFPIFLGSIVAIFGIIVVIKLTNLLVNFFSIKYEHEADLIAVQLTSLETVIKMFNKIAEKEKIYKKGNKLLDIIFAHPSIEKRIEYIKKYSK